LSTTDGYMDDADSGSEDTEGKTLGYFFATFNQTWLEHTWLFGYWADQLIILDFGNYLMCIF
jgi:hypothetical protein